MHTLPPPATAAAARGANEDEQASLQRELIACRQHAHVAERDLAILRKALANKVAEVEALTRDCARQRQRAETAEQRLMRGGPAAGGAHGAAAALGADRKQYDLVADLQARLHASEERNTRGEALIAKLRAFIVTAGGHGA